MRIIHLVIIGLLIGFISVPSWTQEFWNQEPQDERLLHTFENAGEAIFSPDGKYIVIATDFLDPTNSEWISGATVTVIDANTYEELHSFTPDGYSIDGMSMSHDNKYVALAVYQGAFLWGLETGNTIFLSGHTYHVYDIEFLNSKYLLTHQNSTIIVWDITTGKKYKTMEASFIGITADKKYILIKDDNDTAQIINILNGNIIASFSEIQHPTDISPDGAQILSGSDLWDIDVATNNATKVTTFAISVTKFSPNGRQFIGKNETRLTDNESEYSSVLFDIATQNELASFSTPGDFIFKQTFSSDNKQLFITTKNNSDPRFSTFLYDISNLEAQPSEPTPTPTVTPVPVPPTPILEPIVIVPNPTDTPPRDGVKIYNYNFNNFNDLYEINGTFAGLDDATSIIISVDDYPEDVSIATQSIGNNAMRITAQADAGTFFYLSPDYSLTTTENEYIEAQFIVRGNAKGILHIGVIDMNNGFLQPVMSTYQTIANDEWTTYIVRHRSLYGEFVPLLQWVNPIILEKGQEEVELEFEIDQVTVTVFSR